jgi:hypothetical protein
VPTVLPQASRTDPCNKVVRTYSQTTGMWLRGILADDYGMHLARTRSAGLKLG